MESQAVLTEAQRQREAGDYSPVLPFPGLALFWTSCLEKGKRDGGGRSPSYEPDDWEEISRLG